MKSPLETLNWELKSARENGGSNFRSKSGSGSGSGYANGSNGGNGNQRKCQRCGSNCQAIPPRNSSYDGKNLLLPWKCGILPSLDNLKRKPLMAKSALITCPVSLSSPHVQTLLTHIIGMRGSLTALLAPWVREFAWLRVG